MEQLDRPLVLFESQVAPLGLSSQAELRQLFRGTAMAFYKLTGNHAEAQ